MKQYSFSSNHDYAQVTIEWDDGHVSEYPASWLRCHSFSADREPDFDPIVDLPPELWDASTIRDRLRAFDFSDVLSDDATLFEMLRELKVSGLTVLGNAPRREGQIQRLAKRIGYLCPINYGWEIWLWLWPDSFLKCLNSSSKLVQKRMHLLKFKTIKINENELNTGAE